MYRNYINKPDVLKRYVYKILHIMRLTTVILIVSMLQVSASSLAQKFSYVKKGVSLSQVFKELKTQTGYNILWNEKEIDVTTEIDANFKKSSIEEVMDRCLSKFSISYSIDNKMILIKQKEPSFRDKVIGFLTAIEVRGRVLDENDAPLVGAVVKVKGTKQATSTNSNGEFVLTGVDEKAVLVISFLGYEPQEIAASKNIGSIKLALSTDKLEEVEINAGYYTVKDRERTGNITKITAATIEKQPINNPLQALQGRVSGLVIEQQTGIPGGGFKVQIRGRNSVNTSVGNNPLYVIDGVPFPATGVSSNIANGILSSSGSSPLGFINPYDIESIEILKDADATAIYGSRGASGVILITTKKGSIGKAKVNATIFQGISEVGHQIKLLNTEQYLDMRKEAFLNDGLTPSTTDYDVNGTWNQNKYTDWQKELIGSVANSTNASFNLSGGSTNSNYLLGGNYYKEGTVFPGDFGLNRIGMHSSLNLGTPKDRFTVNFTASYYHSKSELIRGDITPLILLAPNAPDPYDQYGKLNWSNNTVYANPMARLLSTNNFTTNNLIANSIFTYQVTRNIAFKISVGYNAILRDEVGKQPLESFAPVLGLTSTSRLTDFSNINNYSFIAEPQIIYRTKIYTGNLEALVGTSFQDLKTQTRTIRASGFNSDGLLESLASAGTVRATVDASAQYRYTAVFARINYTLFDKYFLNLTGRRDGSSRFGNGKQFANFGAIGAGWMFSDEPIFKNNFSFLSLGKIRASYGLTGNDQIGDFGYLALWVPPGTYQGISTLTPVRIANPDFAWETNRKAEVALQLGFLNNKINFEVSYYRNRSSNQLVGISIPTSTGFSSIQGNLPAVVQNTGFEVTADLRIINTGYWLWSTGVNLSIPKNKLVSYPNFETSGYTNTYVIGEPLTVQKVYNVKGVNPQTGLYDIEDKNGNGLLDAGDRYINKFLGQYFYGGLQNSISFKQFSLDFLFSFNKQNGKNYMPGAYSPGYSVSNLPTGNQPSAVLDRWQNIGDNSNIQKFSTGSAARIQYAQAIGDPGGRSIVDASYIRLKSMSIMYDFSGSWLNHLKISSAKISLQGQNLFTITKYIGLDPESQSISNLPPLRTLSLGLNLTL